MKFEIKSRFNASVLFECEADSLKLAVEKAVTVSANLRGANLRDADLRDANLRDADLRDANLRDANLRDANLRDADLRDANLRDADLRGADLRGADLRDADLRGANLGDANLRDADLRDADLRGAKEDYLAKLKVAIKEVPKLYQSLLTGKINGSKYEGECACLVGTIANIRHENYNNLTIDLRPNSDCPSERLFLAIREGDTPLNNQISAIIKDWTEEFMKENDIKIPVMKISWE